MKQFILLALAISVFTVSKAQITKGSTMIGGSIGYNYSDNSSSDTLTSKTKSNGFNFGLNYAKCVKENTFWGVTASFSFSEDKYIYPSYNNSTQYRNFSIGVFERKYYPLITNLYLFLQTGLNYSFNNSNSYNNTKGYRISASAFPGISYKMSKKIYLETSINNFFTVQSSHTENTIGNITTKQNNFSASFQLPTQSLQNLNIGMTIILGK